MSASSDVKVFVLMYGEHHDLHRRNYESLIRHLPNTVPVHIWCNTVCEQTKQMLDNARQPHFTVHYSDLNIPKYKVMRVVFEEFKKDNPYRWVVWFDDDSYITAPDWWKKTTEFLIQKLTEGQEPHYVGQAWFWTWRPGQWEFIETRAWFKGKGPEYIKGKPGVRFATGGMWWLRTNLIRQLDWPDLILNHGGGGDVMLAEACRQNGYRFHHFDYGVKVNNSPRRGQNEKPLGT